MILVNIIILIYSNVIIFLSELLNDRINIFLWYILVILLLLLFFLLLEKINMKIRNTFKSCSNS